MSSSRDDTATLILAILVILAMLGGGVLYVSRKAASFRAMAAAQQARAMEMEARVRSEAANAEVESQRAGDGASPESGPPAGKPDEQASLRRSLDEAAAKLDDGSVKDPGAAASLHSALGQSYLALDDLDASEKRFKAALELHLKALGEADPAVAADRENLEKVARARAR